MPTDAPDEYPHLKKILQQVSERKGFKQPRYDVNIGTKPGDNYLGAVYRGVVTEAENGREPLSVILKTAVASAKRRELCRSSQVFRNEANMYLKVLPTYARLLAEKGLISEGKPYPNVPECLLVCLDGGDEEDTIVLRDMRPLGYAMKDRKQGLDAAHCLVVVRALARLHACSMALEHHDPERAKRLQESVKELFFCKDSPFADMFSIVLKKGEDMFKTRYPEGTPQHARVRKFLDNYFQDMSDIVTPDPEGGNCIVHGDCWINNVLFRYSKESGNVESVCLLDFQISRYCSPVIDLMYLLYACTEKEVRQQHLDSILRAYHSQLQDNLRALGCDEPDKIFSWDRMQSHLKKYGKYGFGTAIFLVPGMMTDSEDIPDLDAACEGAANNGDLQEAFNYETKETVALRDKRICDVGEEMIELGYL